MLAKWMKDRFHPQKDESDILASLKRLVEDVATARQSLIAWLIEWLSGLESTREPHWEV